MRFRTVLAACWMLASGTALAAQAGGGANPLSGTWTGDIGRDQTTRIPITMILKFDGSTAVTGTFTGLPEPGDVKKGTFDPRTGAVTLELGKASGPAVLLVFDGTIIRGTATGRVTGEGETGSFYLTQPAVAGTTANAPAAAGSDMTAVRAGFAEVGGWLIKAADLVPADKYGYRPAPTVRTYGQLIAHVADAHNYYCARAAGRQVQWSDAIEKGSTDKAAVVDQLKRSLESCNAEYAGSGHIGQLMANVAHSSLHYGNMITYIRMLGLVPPSSQ